MRSSPPRQRETRPDAPSVSVVIHAGSGGGEGGGRAPSADVARAVHVLREQTITDWEGIITGEVCTAEVHRLTAGDGRFVRAESSDRPAHEAINAGIDAARGVYLTVLDARDYLAPGALEALIHAASAARPSVHGAFGGFAFTGPLGVLPGDPITGATSAAEHAAAPATVGLDELIDAALFPLHAMIIRRDALGPTRLAGPIDLGGDHDLLLRLAQRGVRWAFAGTRVAAARMDHPRPARALMSMLAARARVIDASLARAEPDTVRRDERRRMALRPYARAAVLLAAFERRAEALAGDARRDPDPTGLAADTAFGNLFAQWWQRSRFLGRPPEHALAASGWPGLPETARGTAALLPPTRIAEGLLEACDPDRPIVLLGLGRNALEVARVLRRLERPIAGRDDALNAPPAWAEADGLRVRLIGRDEPWDRDATYLMSPTDDAAFLARLPSGLRVERWSAVLPRLADEAAAAAIERLAAGRTDIEWPGPARGVFAAARAGEGGAGRAALIGAGTA